MACSNTSHTTGLWPAQIPLIPKDYGLLKYLSYQRTMACSNTSHTKELRHAQITLIPKDYGLLKYLSYQRTMACSNTSRTKGLWPAQIPLIPKDYGLLKYLSSFAHLRRITFSWFNRFLDFRRIKMSTISTCYTT